MAELNKQELRRLAEAFPADLEWDSNTEPFFNGPSGESLGGGSDGTYAVYGKPFRLEGEDYDYDGPTYVERCGVDFAKFMVEARDGVLALIAECDQLKAENERQAAQFKEWQASHHANYVNAAQERDQLRAVAGSYRAALKEILDLPASREDEAYVIARRAYLGVPSHD